MTTPDQGLDQDPTTDATDTAPGDQATPEPTPEAGAAEAGAAAGRFLEVDVQMAGGTMYMRAHGGELVEVPPDFPDLVNQLMSLTAGVRQIGASFAKVDLGRLRQVQGLIRQAYAHDPYAAGAELFEQEVAVSAVEAFLGVVERAMADLAEAWPGRTATDQATAAAGE